MINRLTVLKLHHKRDEIVEGKLHMGFCGACGTPCLVGRESAKGQGDSTL